MFVPSIGVPLWVAALTALVALGAAVLFYHKTKHPLTDSTLPEHDHRPSPLWVFTVIALTALAVLVTANAAVRGTVRDDAQDRFERHWGVTLVHVNGLFPIAEDRSVPVVIEQGGRLYDGLITTRGGQYDLKLVNYPQYRHYDYPYGPGIMEDGSLGAGQSGSSRPEQVEPSPGKSNGSAEGPLDSSLYESQEQGDWRQP